MTKLMKRGLLFVLALLLLITMPVTLVACRDTANAPHESQGGADTSQEGGTESTTGGSGDSLPVTDVGSSDVTTGEASAPDDIQTEPSTEAPEAAVIIGSAQRFPPTPRNSDFSEESIPLVPSRWRLKGVLPSSEIMEGTRNVVPFILAIISLSPTVKIKISENEH